MTDFTYAAPHTEAARLTDGPAAPAERRGMLDELAGHLAGAQDTLGAVRPGGNLDLIYRWSDTCRENLADWTATWEAGVPVNDRDALGEAAQTLSEVFEALAILALATARQSRDLHPLRPALCLLAIQAEALVRELAGLAAAARAALAGEGCPR